MPVQGHASPVRSLTPSDAHDARHLGDLLQLLIAHGEGEFVEGVYWLAKHRLAWVMERDHILPEPAKKAAGLVFMIISPFLAL
jgi:hypothetical protein